MSYGFIFQTMFHIVTESFLENFHKCYQRICSKQWLMWIKNSPQPVFKILFGKSLLTIPNAIKTVFQRSIWSLILSDKRNSHQRCSAKGVLRNFAKFTGKYLCQGLFFNKVFNKVKLLGYIHKFSKIRVILPTTFIWHNGSYAYGKTVTKDIAKSLNKDKVLLN